MCAKGETYHWKQVTELISSFRPLPAPLCNPGLQAPANVSPAAAMPPLPLENQLKKRRLPMAEVPYSAEVQYRSSEQFHPVLKVNYPEHGSHRRAAYVENAPPTLDHQSFPAANHYISHPQQLMHAKDFAHQVQMQESSYSRYFLSSKWLQQNYGGRRGEISHEGLRHFLGKSYK